MARRMRLLLSTVILAMANGWMGVAPSIGRPYQLLKSYRRAAGVMTVPITPSTAGARLVYCDSLSKSYDGKRFQFRDISLGITTGQRVGLVGANGVGKSTLMKCLAGLETPDEGSVGFEGRPVLLYVEQEPARGPNSATSAEWTVADALTEPMYAGPSSSTPQAAQTAAALLAVRAYWAANAAQDAGDPDAEAMLTSAVELMGSADGAWELEQDLDEISSRLDVGCLKFRRRAISGLSGGERKRVALAAALSQSADVLLLDEPTNHLDWEAIDWLVDHLTDRRRAKDGLSLLLVTHDRYFLERTCSEIVELDSAAVHSYKTDGSYETFLRRRNERLAADDADLAREMERLKQEGAWNAKQPKARQAKSKSRVAAFEELKEASAQRVNDRTLSSATSGGGVDLGAAAAAAAAAERAGGGGRRAKGGGAERWLGEKVVRFDGARLSVSALANGAVDGGSSAPPPAAGAGTGARTRVLLDGLSYTFTKGERVGIVGRNGAGKTSFLRALVGETPLSAGVREVGDTVRFGYYDQRGLQTAGREREKVLDYVVSQVPSSPFTPVLHTRLRSPSPPAHLRTGPAYCPRHFDPPWPPPLVSPQVALGVDETAGDGGESARLLAEFGENAVGVSGGGGNGPSSAMGVDVARRLLTKFAFPASRWQDDVAKLSGGERRRLQLLACLAARPNVLVLDEPTNDLDIATLTVLEEYLDSYTGVLVVVSHDRWFCDRVLSPAALQDELDDSYESRRSSLLVFQGDGVVSSFQGVYSDYFSALKSGQGLGGRAECVTGFPSPPPPPPPPPQNTAAPVAAAAGGGGTPSSKPAPKAPPLEMEIPVWAAAAPPPPPPEPSQASAAPAISQRKAAKAIQELNAKKEKKGKKTKVSKKLRDEYASIEAEVEALEVAAAKAQAALDDANSAARRVSASEMMDIASAASEARQAADAKMERYIELEELISEADADA